MVRDEEDLRRVGIRAGMVRDVLDRLVDGGRRSVEAVTDDEVGRVAADVVAEDPCPARDRGDDSDAQQYRTHLSLRSDASDHQGPILPVEIVPRLRWGSV